MKFLRFIVVGALMGLGASTLVKLSLASPAPCNATYRHDTVISTLSDSVVAEDAKTDAQRTAGLSGRPCIGADQGMLFEFGQPGKYPFWMKDMKFPIDIIWINSDHIVVTVDSDVLPSTYPQSLLSSAPAQYVLEIQSGRAQTLNITEGTHLQFNP